MRKSSSGQSGSLESARGWYGRILLGSTNLQLPIDLLHQGQDALLQLLIEADHEAPYEDVHAHHTFERVVVHQRDGVSAFPDGVHHDLLVDLRAQVEALQVRVVALFKFVQVGVALGVKRSDTTSQVVVLDQVEADALQVVEGRGVGRQDRGSEDVPVMYAQRIVERLG